MLTITKLIQRQVPLGAHVKFSLKNGEETSGTLTAICEDHVTVDTKDVLTEQIGGWNPLENKGLAPDDAKSNLIQREILLGSHVKFSQESGEEISGILTEIGQEHVTVDTQNGLATVFTEMIDSWNPLENEGSESDDGKPDGSEETQEKPKNTQVQEDSDSSSANSLSPKVIETLSDIQARFNAQQQNAEIELSPLNFTYPQDELIGWENTDVLDAWVAIKNQYDNAKKINELVNPKFKRIQRIISELKSLTERIPESPSLKQTLAYFYSISNNWDEALQNYQKAAIQSGEAYDWFDVAVSALKLNKEELACHSLEQFFYGGSITDEPKAWYTYVNLLEKFNNLPAFCKLCKTDEYNNTEEGIEILLDTAIYLLQKKGDEALATEITQKQLKGESIKSLLGEACQKLDGEEPAIRRKKTPQKQQVIRPTTPQKQKPQTQTSTKDDNLYKEAKRADQNGRLEKAERLYQECIRRNIRRDTAIMDLAMLYVQLNRAGEAAKLLEDNRDKVTHKQRLDNLLTTTVYPKDGQHQKVIDLLNNTLKHEQNNEKRGQILWQIANAYIGLRDYARAENQLRLALELRPNTIGLQRSLAFCCSQQKRYDEAEEILNQIQNTSPDAKTADLLEAIERAKATGEFTLDDESTIEVETALSYFSGELSKFAQFFLERCEFEGVPPEQVNNEGTYTGDEDDVKTDINQLEHIAKQLGTKRPHDRSNYYLSAARIYFDVGDDRNFFYRYLCRSFASRGDAAVSESKPLDTAREWYCEALTAYDGDRRYRRDEQDAVNSLVRYLYLTLGYAHIDLSPRIPSIDKAIKFVVDNHPDKERAFEAIAYLVLHSRYAAAKVLNRLYSDENLRKMALSYLEAMGVAIPSSIERFNDFVSLWNELRDETFKRTRAISNELRLLNNLEFTTPWLQNSIQRVNNIYPNLFFDLDRQRVGKLREILQVALRLCEQNTSRQGTFEGQANLCQELTNSCQNQLTEIEESPTKLSVEEIDPIIDGIQKKVEAHLNWLYENRKPELTLRLPEDMQSYVPVLGQIEVQIVVENAEGRMPADALKVVTQKDPTLFKGPVTDVELPESLRGGRQEILSVSLPLTDSALQS